MLNQLKTLFSAYYKLDCHRVIGGTIMSVFTSREKKLIKYLSQRDAWVSSNEIVSFFGISLRTLRSDVKNINTSGSYILSSNQGYRIIKKTKEIEELLQDKDQPETSDENNRELIILKELLISKQPLDYFDLANSLFISEQTLLTSITALKKIIAPYEVTIIRRKTTLALKGTEKNIRRLFCDMVYKEAENSILNTAILNAFFVDIDVFEIKNTIFKIISEQQFEINDFALNNIVLHVCIIIDRNKYELQPELFEMNPALLDADSPSQCAAQILARITDKYDFKASRNDFDSIYALLLISMKKIGVKENYARLNEFVEPSIIRFVKKLIVEIYNEYYINLDNDEFISNFALHLNNIINRKMSMRNPLLTSIKDSYPTIYEISVFIAKQIQDQYAGIDMNDHQISYIALHVGAQIEKQTLTKIKTVVINPEYLKLNALIYSKLETNFLNDLSITMVSDESELAKIGSKNIDLILTTMPLKGYYTCEIVDVTVFISQKDIETIFAAISDIKKKRMMENDSLLQYFDGTFCYFEHAKNYEEVIKQLCATHKELDDDFLKRVMIREEISPSEYMNIAVLHPIQCDEKSTFITVGIFKKPFRWRKNDINIIFLLSVSQKDKNNFLKILKQLIEMFSSSRWMAHHSYINTYDKFVRFIKEHK